MKTKKIKRRILSSTLAGLIAVSSLPLSAIPAFAAEIDVNDAVGTLQEPEISDGYYQISNADELYWFADYVNSGNYDAKAVLTKNITINSTPLSSSTNPSSVRSWIPIGTKHDINGDGTEENSTFNGTFDGQGYTISGLYIKDNSWSYAGLFGCTVTADIKNINIKNAYISAGYGVGLIVGQDISSKISNCTTSSDCIIESLNNSHIGGIGGDCTSTTFTDCTNNASVEGYYYYIGGITGILTYGSITNCVNYGTVKCDGWRETGGIAGRVTQSVEINNCTNNGTVESNGSEAGGIVGASTSNISIKTCTNTGSVTTKSDDAGGIVGSASNTQIVNCLNSGNIKSMTSYAGGIAAVAQSANIIANCLDIGTVADSGSNYAGSICGRNYIGCGIARCYTSQATPIGTNEGTNGGAVRTATAEELHNGSIAYYLKSGVAFSIGDTRYSFSGSPWGQDFLYADPYPTLNARPVYYGYDCTGSSTKVFSNYKLNSSVTTSHTYSNGICACGKYATPTYSNGAYRIANAGNLYWFMEYVNSGNTSANAILVNDINLNYGTFSENGEFTPKSSANSFLNEWFPIGYYYDRKDYDNKREDIYYQGTFDGQGYTISGLYIDKTISYAGLFGQTKDATIKNVALDNSYISATSNVGGICGRTYNYSNIINSAVYGNIIKGDSTYIGGICGYNVSTSNIVNCLNRASAVTTPASFCGGICGSGKINNSYSIDTACSKASGNGSADTTSIVSLSQLTSGLVAYSLQNGCTVDNTFYNGNIWGQIDVVISQRPLNTISLPALNGETVYKRYKCESNTAVYTTNENYCHAEPNQNHSYSNGICTYCGNAEIASGIEINETNFPDESFRNTIKQFDTTGNGWLSDAEIEHTITIDATNRNINSLKGIEYFTALQVLYAYGNNLTTLDVSKNTELVMLNCGENQLTTLDVSKNTKLGGLYCYSNELTSIDISMLKNLDNASFANNKFKSLNFSENPVIRVIYAQNNELESINLGSNENLSLLMCDNNHLPYIDLSGCPNVSTFTAKNNVCTYDTVPCMFAPEGINMNCVSNLTGAEINNNKFYLPENTITYTYACNDNSSASFTLIISSYSHTFADGCCIDCGSNNWGDVNLDGNINVEDITLIQQYLVGLENLTEKQLVLADVDGSGIVNIKDATTIQKYLLGLESVI
ncbi:MAG: dockerin type I domain-containing protein [Ruminococcus sp.]|nr:dockerin type I domain-containing protein [Ruminococcus sp.]